MTGDWLKRRPGGVDVEDRVKIRKRFLEFDLAESNPKGLFG